MKSAERELIEILKARFEKNMHPLGGALVCDRRYGKVFVYHNGAQSYYAANGELQPPMAPIEWPEYPH